MQFFSLNNDFSFTRCIITSPRCHLTACYLQALVIEELRPQSTDCCPFLYPQIVQQVFEEPRGSQANNTESEKLLSSQTCIYIEQGKANDYQTFLPLQLHISFQQTIRCQCHLKCNSTGKFIHLAWNQTRRLMRRIQMCGWVVFEMTLQKSFHRLTRLACTALNKNTDSKWVLQPTWQIPMYAFDCRTVWRIVSVFG